MRPLRWVFHAQRDMSLWFVGPPAAQKVKHKSGKLLARAALAGGIASGTTTLMMYPLDTLKTRVQSTAGASIGSIVRSVPDIGLRGLYRCAHRSAHNILSCMVHFCTQGSRSEFQQQVAKSIEA